jgi:hypothetical protein
MHPPTLFGAFKSLPTFCIFVSDLIQIVKWKRKPFLKTFRSTINYLIKCKTRGCLTFFLSVYWFFFQFFKGKNVFQKYPRNTKIVLYIISNRYHNRFCTKIGFKNYLKVFLLMKWASDKNELKYWRILLRVPKVVLFYFRRLTLSDKTHF